MKTFLSILVTLVPSVAMGGYFNIIVRNPDAVVRHHWPVTSGVPISQGQFRMGDAASLTNEQGQIIPVQTEPLSYWPDHSVKWLLLDFQADLTELASQSFQLKYGKHAKVVPLPSILTASKTRQGITLDTGVLKVNLDRHQFRLLDKVWLDQNGNHIYEDSERMTQSRAAGLTLSTPDGERFTGNWTTAEMEIEQSGPMRVCVRISGSHLNRSGKRFRYIVRLHAYRGLPHLKIMHTFIHDHRPETMTRVQDMTLSFTSAHRKSAKGLFGNGHTGNQLFQQDDQRYLVDGQPAGTQASGWAALVSESGGLAVGLRDFWENWPKGIRLVTQKEQPPQLHMDILPRFTNHPYHSQDIQEEAKLHYYLRDGVYTFKIGFAKTHELWATFFEKNKTPNQLNDFYQAIDKPLLAQRSSGDVFQTRVIGNTPPSNLTRFSGYDSWLQGFFQLHLDDREHVREYGLMNYGDWYNVNWDSWGNLEYDTGRCFFIQYLRSGDRRFFDRAAAAAKHLIDVDTTHAVNEDVRQFGGSYHFLPGSIWAHTVGHTGGYYATYDGEKYINEAPLVMKGPYQVGMSDTGHVWMGGAFDYYHLTGDRRAQEIAIQACDVLASRMPTRYTDHLRGIGWPMNMMLNAYESTGQKKYLEAARKNWHVLKEKLDHEKGWVVMLAYGHCNEPSTSGRCHGQNTYMLALTLSVLARFHQITDDPDVLRALSTGINQMIRQCYSKEHGTFWLTSCDHLKHNPPPATNSAVMLSARAFSHEYRHTGNRKHRDIWTRAFKKCMESCVQDLLDKKQQGATGYSSGMFLFTPFGLDLIDQP